MSTLLAIDTATSACSVALSLNGEVHQLREDRPREHARRVLPLIDQLLSDAGIDLSSLDALAYSSGPGSFTGLRIGFGVIQGLAFGAGLPVVGVSTLQALSHKARFRFGLQEGLICPVLDARMNEIYWGRYRVSDTQVVPELDDRATPPDAIVEQLPATVDVAVGDGWSFVDRARLTIRHYEPDLLPDAASVLQLALPRYEQGLAVAVEEAGLTYVRNEIHWRKREKIRPRTDA